VLAPPIKFSLDVCGATCTNPPVRNVSRAYTTQPAVISMSPEPNADCVAVLFQITGTITDTAIFWCGPKAYNNFRRARLIVTSSTCSL
jgi:hypothetical protein